ncbi:hypothetical protein SMGD1_2494 [Sulfurimonas gotlandica GD1]|uniref:Uncharacterized protein n=1 Tax=Sulfurimonas gotlandica (strain DSM 19862 / JCM 16533 / GD1) TaxID=929558 RepID=B6BNE7_SULGG|nr:hypothetical protein [Sulfurimonas gotlandica]EDZ61320.1 hypothetical protein CBGD1_2386 [Sulfurimonas gotlandica GD1]EHP31017.1 hypothetical protein SMGD1_2494 [Sulfurimonas gotlandica GD1]
MCEIDWNLTADMLTGAGTLLAGLAAIFVLPWQLGFRKEAKESKKEIESLHTSLKLMFPMYKQYMASEAGIVWSDYTSDADNIVKGISKKFALDERLVRSILDELQQEGKI